METKSNRRGFLTQLGVAGAAVGASAAGLRATPAVAAEETDTLNLSLQSLSSKDKGNFSVLENLSCADFAQHIKTAFRVATTSQDGLTSNVDLTLVAADVSPNSNPSVGHEAFSLLFSGSAAKPLHQGTYSFSHPQMGKLDILIVPIAEKDGERKYEAIFSRLNRA